MVGERWVDGWTRETLTWDLFLKSQEPREGEGELERLCRVLDDAFAEDEKK